MKNKAKALAVAVPALVVFWVGVAYAQVAPTPSDAVGDAAEGMKNDLITIGFRVLPYAAAVLVIALGWRLARKFVRA